MVKYFIYYTYENGHGNAEYSVKEGIKTFDDIQKIEKDLQERVVDKDSAMRGEVCILNFIKL